MSECGNTLHLGCTCKVVPIRSHAAQLSTARRIRPTTQASFARLYAGPADEEAATLLHCQGTAVCRQAHRDVSGCWLNLGCAIYPCRLVCLTLAAAAVQWCCCWIATMTQSHHSSLSGPTRWARQPCFFGFGATTAPLSQACNGVIGVLPSMYCFSRLVVSTGGCQYLAATLASSQCSSLCVQPSPGTQQRVQHCHVAASHVRTTLPLSVSLSAYLVRACCAMLCCAT